MLVVVDTNVIVSAFWTINSNPSKIVDLVLNGKLTICYNSKILAEYTEVLQRPKFLFEAQEVHAFLAQIVSEGFSVIAMPSTFAFPDEDDRMFYDVAKTCGAIIITGNKKHYPNEEMIYSPAEFLETSFFV